MIGDEMYFFEYDEDVREYRPNWNLGTKYPSVQGIYESYVGEHIGGWGLGFGMGHGVGDTLW